MNGMDWDRVVLVFSIVCQAVLIWRLWSQKLTRVYVYLAAFLGWETLQDLAALPVRPRSTAYSWVFFLTTPVLWLLAYFVVLELYRLILEDYPGIASVGRKAVSVAMALALLIGAVYAIPDLKTRHAPFPVLQIYIVFERSIVLALLVFLVLIQLFLLRYRLRLSPNRMVYVTGYAIYFALFVGWDVVITGLGVQNVVYAFNVWIIVVSDLILLAGAVMLRQKGEVKPQLEAVDSSDHRARLNKELADINQMLARAARGRG